MRILLSQILDLLDLLADLVAGVPVKYVIERFTELLVVCFHSGFRVGRSEPITSEVTACLWEVQCALISFASSPMRAIIESKVGGSPSNIPSAIIFS